MTEFLIRPAKPLDAPVIAGIHATTVGRTSLQVPPGDGASPRELRFWREAINYAEPQLHVASVADVVIGVVGFDRSRDPGTPPTMGEIWTIQVLPAYWGQGAGLALWDTAREELLHEGCTEVSVWIGLDNDRAMRFHELAGFKRVMSSARTIVLSGKRSEQIRLKRKLQPS
ncbi:MAG: GNAT family N-acetyltransferase [Burkholderiaceae bacterium]